MPVPTALLHGAPMGPRGNFARDPACRVSRGSQNKLIDRKIYSTVANTLTWKKEEPRQPILYRMPRR
jgi:hypothetical protein